MHVCGRFVAIFSTYVEVFPDYVAAKLAEGDFLHVCGGVS